MKRNVSVVRFKFCCNILISGKIIKEMPSSEASVTPCISDYEMEAWASILGRGVNFSFRQQTSNSSVARSNFYPIFVSIFASLYVSIYNDITQ